MRLNAVEAWDFDSKMDDGFPLSGRFYATASTYIYRVPGAASNQMTGCLSGGTSNAYRFNNDIDRECFIDIDGKF